MPALNNARFFISSYHWHELPQHNGMEIALVGRSNSGKSSALNTLTQRNRLAFVSKQPGRTQLINFFEVGAEKFLVDLPGYGYAKVPEKLRIHWQDVLVRYLSQRSHLRGLILIMDCRHPFTTLDKQMLHWFCPSQKPVHILLSKADKLSRHQASLLHHQIQTLLREAHLHDYAISYQLFSSLNAQGLDTATQTIEKWFTTPL